MAYSPQQLSLGTHFAEINYIPENQCEKHKKASLALKRISNIFPRILIRIKI